MISCSRSDCRRKREGLEGEIAELAQENEALKKQNWVMLQMLKLAAAQVQASLDDMQEYLEIANHQPALIVEKLFPQLAQSSQSPADKVASISR